MLKKIHSMSDKQKGFTLAELLVVIAVIGVLTAVSIPIFSTQLEKSREVTDLANIRAAYAEIMAAAVQQDTSSPLYDSFLNEYTKSVYLEQKKDGWSINADGLTIGGVSRSDSTHWKGDAKANGKCVIVYDINRNDVTLAWDGYTIHSNFQWEINGDYIKINNKSYNDAKWPASAVPEFISAKNKAGQSLIVEPITADKYPTLKKWLDTGGGYEIGYFITDSSGKILVNSGGQYISSDTASGFEIKTDNIADGADVKIAIQFFKMKSGTDHDSGSVKLTDEEARELEKIFSVK